MEAVLDPGNRAGSAGALLRFHGALILPQVGPCGQKSYFVLHEAIGAIAI
jgi:hypothetical protein